MRDAATPWAGTAAGAAVVRNRTASDACVVTDGIVYQTRNTYVRSQAGALLPSDALQRVVGRNRAQASVCALADGFAYSITEPALVTSGISMHIVPLGNGNIDSRYPRAYGDMLYIADGASMSDGAVSTVWAASGLDKNLHIGHDPDGDIDSTYVYTPPVNHAPVWTNAPTALTFSQGVGGTQAFGPFASDPDADTLAFSLVGTAYSGISINATTGLLTVAASAAAAVRALAIRVSDPAGLFADHACTVTVVAQTGSIKWNPGFYTYLSPSNGKRDGSSQRASDLAWMQTYASDSRVKGFQINKFWSEYEETQGNYSRGFDMVDWYLARMGEFSHKKRLLLIPSYIAFDTNVNPAPAYINAAGWVEVIDYRTQCKVYIAACMDRWIALVQALAQRYNSHPLVEAFTICDETALPLPSGVPFSQLDTQIKRLVTTAIPLLPNTLTRIPVNYHGAATDCRSLLQTIEATNNAGVGCAIVGGPDHEYGLRSPQGTVTNPSNYITAPRLWRGAVDSGITWKDVRGVHPWLGETQQRGAGDPLYFVDRAQDILDFHISTMKASHVVLTTYMAPPNYAVDCCQWENGIYQYWSNTSGTGGIVQRNGATSNVVPSILAGRTITGEPTYGPVDYDAPFESSISPFSLSKTSGSIVAVDASNAREGNASLITHIPTVADWRAEVELGWGGRRPVGQPTWYGWSLYLDPAWAAAFPTWELIGQWHAKNEVTLYPTMGFWSGYSGSETPGRLRFFNSYTTDNSQTIGRTEQYDLGAISDMRGVWTDFVIYFVPSASGTNGQLKVWINGVLKVQRLNTPNYVNEGDGYGPYPKFGIYNGWRYSDPTPGVTFRRAWYDAYRQVTGASAVYTDVAPRGNR